MEPHARFPGGMPPLVTPAPERASCAASVRCVRALCTGLGYFSHREGLPFLGRCYGHCIMMPVVFEAEPKDLV